MITLILLLLLAVVAINVLRQTIFRNILEPPIVFHLFPLLGSTIEYGLNPEAFFVACRVKYGDVFTFILLGKKMTVCLGTKGNDFILNGRVSDVNAEQVYRKLTAPVFGEGVVYDVPNSKMMEQKKLLKYGITTERLRSYVPLIANEFNEIFSKECPGSTGMLDISRVIAELTIYTASRTLQGEEVRRKFDSTFATLYHDLDMGFTPINFIAPWLPLPSNQRRDRAQRRIAQVYMNIIARRRSESDSGIKSSEDDMIRHLMSSEYKNGNAVTDKEVAHILIALLMAGQHSSSSIGAWILLRLCSRPDIQNALYEEQIRQLGLSLAEPTYEDLARLTLNNNVVKETLRLHAPIHSLMRAVTSPLEISIGPPESLRTYKIPTSHILLAAPGVTAQSSEYFKRPAEWDPFRWEKHVELQDSSDKIDYGYGMVSKGTHSPYLPFGAGRHCCIGEDFAHIQLGAIVALVVRSFRLRGVDREYVLPKTDYSSLFSRPVSPARIILERR